MTVTIYARCVDDVTKILNRFARKAARYSIPFSFTFGNEYPKDVRVREYDPVDGYMHTARVYKVAAVDVEINCEQLICANGWTVLAKIEHGDKANIVTGFGEIDSAWYTLAPHCDHCNTNRFRSVTYIVERDGERRQVGRGCLHEYTGIDPALAALWASIRDVEDDFSMDCDEWYASQLAPMYEVTEVLAHACDSIKAKGYRKSDEINATRDDVLDRIHSTASASEEAVAKAEQINAWLLNLKPEEMMDLERNCQSMAMSGWIKSKHFGRMCYMPIAYDKYLERKAREEKYQAEREAAKASQFVGNIGERITIKTETAKLMTSWETQFGTTYLYRFTDELGNVYIWFASRTIDVQDNMILKGTVKDHSERDGVKQTVITRCKAA